MNDEQINIAINLFKDANIYLDRKYEKLSSYYAVISQNLQKTDNY